MGPIKIRASTEVLAREVARVIPPAIDAIQSVPDMHPIEPMEIHVWESGPGSSQGKVFERRIEIKVDPALPKVAWWGLGSLIAHELAHYHLGESWRTLPPLIEEGLVDLLAYRAQPEEASLRRVQHAQILCDAIERDAVRDVLVSLDLPTQEFTAVPMSRYGVRSAFGWFLAERIGIEGLRALALRARSERRSRAPSEWFFEAARIDPQQPRSWLPAIQSAAGLRFSAF